MAVQPSVRLGRAWLQALTGFLDVYNPTVMALRADRPWLPLPVFRFDVWLGGLIAGIALLALTSVFVFRGARLATVLGRTLAGIRLTGAMPGVYSSPVLLIASVYLLLQLWRTKPGATAIP